MEETLRLQGQSSRKPGVELMCGSRATCDAEERREA